MITLCHAAKGGSGTTLASAILAVESPTRSTLLVDLAGDCPAMLGIAEPDRPGVLDWLGSDAPPAHLDDLLIEVTSGCTLLPATSADLSPLTTTGASTSNDASRWSELHDWFGTWQEDHDGAVVIDAGITTLPSSFAQACDERWLVTRACYLSLRRAARLTVRPTGIVFVDEPGRSLRERDVEASVGAPIVATIAWDVRTFRCIDAGLLLAGRLPRIIRHTAVRQAA